LSILKADVEKECIKRIRARYVNEGEGLILLDCCVSCCLHDFVGILKEAGCGRVMRNGQNGSMNMCVEGVSIQKEEGGGKKDNERRRTGVRMLAYRGRSWSSGEP
jgi:hypothetical protein